MRKNESKLIKCRYNRLLTAYGHKLLTRLFTKAAAANGMHRYNKDFRDTIGAKLESMFYDLVFLKNLEEIEIIKFINSIDATVKPKKIEQSVTIDAEILQ